MKNVTKTNAFFAFIVVFYLLISYTVALAPNMVPETLKLFLVDIIFMVPCVLYVFWMKPDTVKDISYGAVSFGTILKVIVMIYLLLPMMTFINGVSSIFVDNEVVTMLDETSKNPLWLQLAGMALAPAIVEEFVFRGLIFHGLKKRNPFWAIIISSLLFGAIHMNVNQFLYAFAMGIFFSLITYATGSMWPSTIMHFIYNAQSVILSYVIINYFSDTLDTETVTATITSESDKFAMINAYLIVYGFLLVIAVLGCYLAVKMYFSICRKNRGEENVKRIFTKSGRSTFDESQGKFIDGYFMFAVGLCILYMILNEIG